MPKLRVLSGGDILKILRTFGFNVAAQKGSHIKLTRTTSNSRQTLTIPDHPELDRGTIKAIFRQATRYIKEEELAKYFYTE